jgi:hypothetical protein
MDWTLNGDGVNVTVKGRWQAMSLKELGTHLLDPFRGKDMYWVPDALVTSDLYLLVTESNERHGPFANVDEAKDAFELLTTKPD